MRQSSSGFLNTKIKRLQNAKNQAHMRRMGGSDVELNKQKKKSKEMEQTNDRSPGKFITAQTMLLNQYYFSGTNNSFNVRNGVPPKSSLKARKISQGSEADVIVNSNCNLSSQYSYGGLQSKKDHHKRYNT